MAPCEHEHSYCTTTHPDTALSLNNLAALYCDQGKYEQAEPLLRRALAIFKQQLGEKHPLTVNSLNNLTELHRRQPQWMSQPNRRKAINLNGASFFGKATGNVWVSEPGEVLIEASTSGFGSFEGCLS